MQVEEKRHCGDKASGRSRQKNPQHAIQSWHTNRWTTEAPFGQLHKEIITHA